MQTHKVEIDLLFETSWEVCNKIGGIYTVLSTKANTLQTLYKDKNIFIGPDVWTEQTPSPYFKESKTLLKTWRQGVELPYGITVRVGRWDVPGKPIAILVGFEGMYAVKDEFYGMMWDKYHVDSLHAYGDYDEACAFSHAAGIVIESLVHFLELEKGRVIAHFDEWTTGMGLLYVKAVLPSVATMFTTHATSIGRSICGNGKDLYRYFKGYDGDQMARELNMESKHSLEKAAAHNADCFTTVSDITADECEQLLARKPHVVTPNGFEENFVPVPRTFKTKYNNARKAILETAQALTGIAYPADTFIVGTSGRCEFRNKGLDMFIDSVVKLGELNPSRPVLALVMVPAWVAGPRADLKKELDAGKGYGLTDPIITHNLHNYHQDPVVRKILETGFVEKVKNAPENVTAIYVPCYLDGNDGIFNKPYYDLLLGLDATVFPSYYEPWGYTPLESIAFGVPTVTTSLSGFGRWILGNFPNDVKATGVRVVSRDDASYVTTCNEIACTLLSLLDMSTECAQSVHTAARATSGQAAWQYFIKYYIEAFDIALAGATERMN